ncbi:MAG: PAS domain-containing sensor histidine kinase [Chloroflexi bacterium]|nr:PAS domain-containing sensor histidine kinase [Chloroflexota bacterium]
MEEAHVLSPDLAPETYFLLRDDKITLVSGGAAARYGYRPDEIIGRSIAEFVAPEARRQTLDILETRLGGERAPERYETTLLAKDGTRIPVQVSVWLARGDGTVTSAGVVADLTQAKRRQAERQQLQEVLRFYAGHVVTAQEEERTRIARELHDDTIQQLLLVCHRLQDIAAGSHGRLPKRAQNHLESVSVFVERIINEVRGFTRDLRPPVLDDMGLVSALRWLAGRLASEDGPCIEVRVAGEERRLRADTESALFRIVQEALNNVRRHAGATKAVVGIEFGGEQVTVSITDDGGGFNMPAKIIDFASQGKLGLLGLTERVHMLNGQCRIESEPGKGTTVSINVRA